MCTSTPGNNGLKCTKKRIKQGHETKYKQNSDGTTVNVGSVEGPTVVVPSEFPEDVGDAGCESEGQQVQRAQPGNELCVLEDQKVNGSGRWRGQW